ncbi:MAG TPA: hypothetical protein VEX43_11510 [Chthoniobacterales bacterium]|nr:hypothetical protein [Chthoniobacterales bacterium]
MKRALTIAAGVAVGLAVIVVVLLAIQFLISGNLTGIDVHNDSNVPLQAVAVFVPGAVASGHRSDMSPGDWGGFGVQTKMFLPLRIVFDAQGQHYEVSRRVLLPPIGAYNIKIHIDPQMQVKVVRRILW